MSSQSYGFIETRGLVGAIEAADAMAKAANVRLVTARASGPGWSRLSEETWARARRQWKLEGMLPPRAGELVAAHVIPRPDRDTEALVMIMLGHDPVPSIPVSGVRDRVGSLPGEERKSAPPAGHGAEEDVLHLLSQLRGDGLRGNLPRSEHGKSRRALVHQEADGWRVGGKSARKYYARSGRHQ